MEKKNSELLEINVLDGGMRVVSARELHKFLGVKTYFTTWIKPLFPHLIENYDYQTRKSFMFDRNLGGRPKIDYAITLDVARFIFCWHGRTKKAKQANQYFIDYQDMIKETLHEPPKLNKMKTEKFNFEQYLKSVGFFDDIDVLTLYGDDGCDYQIKLIEDNFIYHKLHCSGEDWMDLMKIPVNPEEFEKVWMEIQNKFER